MFELEKAIIQGIKNHLLFVSQPILANPNVQQVCNGCTGACKQNCTSGCKGSCKNTCTRSCKGHSR